MELARGRRPGAGDRLGPGHCGKAGLTQGGTSGRHFGRWDGKKKRRPEDVGGFITMGEEKGSWLMACYFLIERDSSSEGFP